MKIPLLALAAVLLAACETYPPPEPPIVQVDGSARTTCGRACANLAAWKCPEAQPSATETCGQLCQRAEASGFDLASACIADAKTLEAAKACRNKTGSPALRCRD